MADTTLTQSDDPKAVSKAKSQFSEIVKTVPLERQLEIVRAVLNQPPSPPAKPR